VKRILLFLFALFSFALMASAPAEAGEWHQKEIFWRKTSVGSPTDPTAIYSRDTTFAPYPIKTSLTADTTGSFSISEAALWSPYNGTASAIDTAWVAFLVITVDSSAATVGSTVSAITTEIDGRAGGFSGGVVNGVVNPGNWTQVDSTVTSFVANGTTSSMYNQTLTIPIRAIRGALGQGSVTSEAIGNHFYRLMAFEQLRVRITAATGVLSGNLRAFIRYRRE
jgi:hypothetical protein